MIEVHFGDNLTRLQQIPDQSVDLIYVDPPLNTGKTQARTRLSTTADPTGDRVGFKGQTYKTVKLGSMGYADIFDDYLSFLVLRLEEAFRVLTST